jgi:probable rRNA maturation factor
MVATIDLTEVNVSVDLKAIAVFVKSVLEYLQQEDVEISIVLCDNAFIHPLNKMYREKDRPTDVLSFSQREGEFANPNDPVLGDVILSLEQASIQAKERSIPFTQELSLLLVHGILHLLGYDHIKEDEAEIMEAKERKILSDVNVEWSPNFGYLSLSNTGEK